MDVQRTLDLTPNIQKLLLYLLTYYLLFTEIITFKTCDKLYIGS